MTKDEIIADLQDELSRLGQKIEFDDRQVSGQISDLMAMKTNFQSAQKQIEQITCQLTAIQKSTTTKPLKEVGSNLVDTNLAKQIAALQGKLGQLQTSQQELASQSPLPPSPITIVCPHQGKKAFGQKPPSSLTNTKPQTTDDQKEMIFFKDGLEELIPPTPLKTFTTTDPTDYPFPTDLKKDEQELIPRSTKDDQVISPKTVSSKPLDEQKSYYGRKDDHYSQEKKVIFPPNELEKGAKRENITPSQTPGAKTPFSVVAEFNIDQELSEAKAEMQTTDHLINQTIAADDNALEELQLKYNQQ